MQRAGTILMSPWHFHAAMLDQVRRVCPRPLLVGGGGGDQANTRQATHIAGNTASVSAIINLDKTVPSITATVSPAPNRAGWNKTNPTVTFTCSDATSGIAGCPAPQTVTTEGIDQTVDVTATDI